MQTRHLVPLIASFALAACRPQGSTPALATPPLLANSEQLVVVTTPSWDAVRGTLWRFSRASSTDAWHAESAPVPIVVGRTGLAWGVGFDAMDELSHSPHKREGDGKAPAGIFPLDTVFGYAPGPQPALHMPYVQLTPASECVDDTTSIHYNTVVERNAVPRIDWNSAEHMRAVWQYEMGVIVGYNAPAPARGRGSCIFLHIWDGPDSHTAGCTAFDRDELRRVVEWLDRARRPVLVQMPADEYARRAKEWKLPNTHQ